MNRQLFYHILFWLIYWLVFAFAHSRYDGLFMKYAISEAAEMPARIAATYLAFWWVNRTANRSNWLIFSGLAMVVLAGGFANRLVKFWWTVPKFFPDSTIIFWNYRAFYDVFDVVLPMAIALSAWLFFKNQKSLRDAETLRAEKSAAELQALRSQVQPHFLFNTINNIYALARQNSPKTAPVTLKLAQLLRFVLYETEKPEIPLSAEIQILENYLELQKLRFEEDRLDLAANFEVESPQFLVAPLLLLPLVENAFKHGAGEQRENAFVKIHLRQKADRLDFWVRNSLPEEKNLPISDGIGLKNLRRQLELLYPGRHGLEISEGFNFFETTLWLSI